MKAFSFIRPTAPEQVAGVLAGATLKANGMEYVIR